MLGMDRYVKKYLVGKNLNVCGGILTVLYSLAAFLPVSYDIMKKSVPVSLPIKNLFAIGNIILMVLMCLLLVHVVRYLYIPIRYSDRAGRGWENFWIFFSSHLEYLLCGTLDTVLAFFQWIRRFS